MTSSRVMATTGVPSTCTMLVAYMLQQNSGIRNHVRPGARILWIVTMKLMPVTMDENPAMKTARIVNTTLELEYIELYGV